jgi:hypothetical protein
MSRHWFQKDDKDERKDREKKITNLSRKIER